MPFVQERVTCHIPIMLITRPRLLTDGEMDILYKRHGSVLAFRIIKHVVVDTAVGFIGIFGIIDSEEEIRK